MNLLNYPRLAAPVAMSVLREWHGLDAADLATKSAGWRAPVTWYEIGPRRDVEDPQLRELAEDLRAIATEHGYPERRRDQAGYERETGIRLLDEPVADVGAEGVWAYLAVALVPDVVVWRWGWPKLKAGEASGALNRPGFSAALMLVAALG